MTEGWTPVLDILAKQEGLTTAAVFGRIWRFCQMEEGVCRASQETIGDSIGVSAKTVQRHAQRLCALDYLEDLTPTLKGAPHIYRDTRKLQALQVELGQNDLTQVRSESPNSPVAESYELGRKVLTDRSESPIKRGEDRTKKEEREGVAGATDLDALPPYQANFQALCDLCVKPVDLLTKDEKGHFNQVEKFIREKGRGNWRLILKFGEWWYQHDWRGKKGQAPEPSQVRKEWGRFMNWYRQNGNAQGEDSATAEQRAELDAKMKSAARSRAKRKGLIQEG